jgi:C4-dicarboxylate-specific signal transduction histidine kinase
VNELVGQVLTLAHSDLTRRGIAMECRLASALPPVTGDRVQLQQVLLNLVNNASDAMAEVLDRPRELIVETRACDEDTVSIVVTDSGHGLCIADTSKIFQPFYSTKQDGMGIGLSVCRTVIEAHGGSIRATKRQPYGAVLEVDLPAGKNA